MADTRTILQNTVRNVQDMKYHPLQKYDFTKKTRLYDELFNVNLRPIQVMKWEVQIAKCIKYAYFNFDDCPDYIDPKTILVDANKDIVHHTVVFSRRNNTAGHEVRFIDSLISIHSTIFKPIYNTVIPKLRINELILIYITGKYFYTAFLSTCKSYNVTSIYQLIKQFHDMVELGMFKELSLITSK